MKKNILIKKTSLAKVLHRTSVLLLFLLVNFATQAQVTLPAFTLSVTATAESCTNNGALAFSTTGTDPGATVTYAIYKAPNFTTAIATTTSNSYTGLNGGAYRVIATQSMAGHTSNSQTWDGNISANVIPLNFTVAKTDVTCPNSGAINVTINAGTPAAVNAYRITGPMNVGPQSSGSFTGLSGGSYVVSVTDNCGEIVTQTVTLTTFTPNVIFADNSNGVSSYNTSRNACGFGDFRQFLRAGANNNVMVYPLTLDYIVHPPGGGPTITTTKVITGTNHFGTTLEDVTTSIPFYTVPFVLDLKITDACGNVFTATRNINNPAIVDSTIIPANCSGSYFSLGPKYMVSPFTYEVLLAPPGYTIGAPSSSNLVGGVGNPIPDGTYEVRVMDACGIFIDKTVNVSTPNPFVFQYKGTGCGAGNGTFGITQPNTTFTFSSARITAGPAGFSASYPVNVTSNISADGYSVFFQDVAGGTYTVETTDNCGHVLSTVVIVNGYNQGTIVADKVQKCSSFDVDLNVTGDNLDAANQNILYWLQIKDPISGNWGHPTTGNYSTAIPSATNAQSLTNGIQQGSWATPGTYRIVKTFKTVNIGPGTGWGYGKDCYDVLNTFDYATLGLKAKDLYSFECTDGVNYSASLAGYDGVEPYEYGITTKNGSPFVVNNGNNSLFTGLTSGIYNFTITDACGNVVNSLLDITKLGLPKLTAVNICNGSTTGKLSVDGVPYLNFSWTKDADPTVLSTSSTLSFPTFNTATDIGTYHVRLTSSPPNLCIDEVLDYKITSNLDNPNSGANSTTAVCRSVINLDLDTLLPVTADPYGTWVETTNPSSGNLNGHLWSPSVSATGSFTFTYTVNGLCSGTSVSIYTVINTAAPAAPTANVTQPTCTLSTGTITVTAPVAAPDITYMLTGTNPVIPAVTNATGIFSGLASGTYDVTASAGACISTASSFTVNAQPVTPAIALFSAVTQPTCSIATGSFTITNYDATKTYTFTPNTGVNVSATGVVTAPAGSYTATVTDVSSGCTSAASAGATINVQPVTPVAPTLGTVTQPTCATATGSFIITNYDATYMYAVTPTTGVSISATGVVTAPAGSYTVTATLGACTSPSSGSTTVNVQPLTPAQPVLGAVTQPTTCASPNGSFTITNYDATYTYAVTPTTGVSISATGVVTAPAGNYTVTATLGACTSVASLSATVNATPAAPAIALFSAVTQPTCSTATGSFTVTNYDATKTYAFTPNTGVNVSATGVVTAPAGSYTATVTDVSSGCTSAASASATINVQPVTPVAPTLGTVTQPTCATATGSFTITNYDATYTYAVTPTTGVSISATGVVTVPTGSYTVTATLGACTSPSSASTTVNVQPLTPAQPVLGVVTQPTTCASPNGSFTIANYDATYTYAVTPTTGVSISATGVVTAPAGNYTVTATLGACTSVASLSATVNAAPAAPAIALFSTVTQPTCSTATGSFTIINYDATKTYTFTPNTGVNVSATGVVTAPAGSYTATVTDVSSGCTSAASASATINVQPVTPVAPTLGTVTQPTCATATGSFTITNYDATYTYAVTPTTGVSISVTGVVTVPAGSYTVTATLGTCTSPSSTSTTVDVQPLTPAQPVLGAVTQPTTCASPNGSFTITNYNATYTYAVTPTTGVSISATGVVTAPAGNYTATATSGACTSVASLSATVNAAPAAPAIALFSAVTQPTCSTATGSFTITNYDATKTYAFTPATGVNISAAGVVTASAGSYTAIVTDVTSGCTSAASASTTVNARPVTPIAPTLGVVTQPTCATATGSFTITNYDATYTYAVTPTTGVSISATGVVTASAGTYTVTATLGACTSPSSASTTVNVQPLTPAQPVLGAVTQPTTCASPNGSFTITNYDAAYTYTVTPATGVSISAAGVVTAPAGNYTITATLGACTSPSASATVNAAPLAPATVLFSAVTHPTCSTATGSFTITNYDATKTYAFTPSTGVSVSGTGVVTAPAGSYTATVTDVSSGCTSAASASSIVNAQPVTPATALFSAVTQPTCSIATGSFTITNYDARKNYAFTPATGVSISVTGVVTAPAGTYTAIVTDVTTGCISSVSNSVVIQSVICAKIDDYTLMPIKVRDGGTTPNVLINDTFNGLPIILSEVNLTGVNVPTGLTLNNDGTITVAPNTPAGNYVVTYSICEKLNPSNCDTTIATVVVATTVIQANDDGYTATPINENDGGTTPNVLANDTLNGLPVIASEVNLTGVTVPTGFTLNTDGTITVAPNTPAGNYTIIYSICEKSNPTNCDTATVTVAIDSSCIIEVFNAVSPDEDGNNDLFYVRGLECYPDTTVEIYNRWGVLVFERDHYNNAERAFKGISEGRVTVNASEELPVGTYYYVLKFKDSNANGHQKAGYLYINRK